MSDENETTEQQNLGEQYAKSQESWKPPASQEDFDRMVADRLDRERRKFADYDELKTKATEYDKAQEAALTEQQKLAKRAEEAERRAAEAETKALRAEVASTKGVPASALTGSTREEMEAAADALLSWRGEAAPSARKTPKSLKSGSAGSDEPTGSRAAAAIRQLRGANH